MSNCCLDRAGKPAIRTSCISGVLRGWVAIWAGIAPAGLNGGVMPFDETFSGNGPHYSAAGTFSGLDNEYWKISRQVADGDASVEISHRGLSFDSVPLGDVGYARIQLNRGVTGFGSFTEQLVVHNLSLGKLERAAPQTAHNQIQVIHSIDGAPIVYSLRAPDGTTGDDVWSFMMRSASKNLIQNVPRADNVALGVVYDETAATLTFLYDDLDDAAAPLEFPFEYTPRGTYPEEHTVSFAASASAAGQWVNGTLGRWTLTGLSSILGDFNGNDVLDTGDIEMLSHQVRSSESRAPYDLNGDGRVDHDDRRFWVRELKRTYFGDSNLDGEFNTADLVLIFRSGEYEDGVVLNSTWVEGDWDGDGDFTTGDLVTAFRDGGFEARDLSQAISLPEPAAALLFVAGFAPLLSAGRRWI